MPQRRLPRPADAWERSSASKLSSPCKFRTFHEHILKITGPTNPLAARGQAVHYFFMLFLRPHPSTGRYPFEDVEAYVKQFGRFWFGAVDGVHGFDGWKRPPTPVQWDRPEQPGALYGESIKILRRFHGTYVEKRHDGTTRLAEQRFVFVEGGITWSGIVDLIEATPDGAVIIDHKDRCLSEEEVKTGTQFTFYQYAYYRFFAPRLAAKFGLPPPLTGLAVHNYRDGTLQPIPLRDDRAIGRLQYYLVRDHAYFKGVLTSLDPHLEYAPQLRSIELEDIETGDISPLLPRGQHCRYCRCVLPCIDWEEQSETERRETASDLFLRHHGGSLAPRAVPHPRLSFESQPIVRAGRAAYRTTVTQTVTAAKQAPLGFELPPRTPLPRRPQRRKPRKQAPS